MENVPRVSQLEYMYDLLMRTRALAGAFFPLDVFFPSMSRAPRIQ